MFFEGKIMHEDFEILSLKNALDIIELHFTKEEGIVARLENNESINNEDVQTLKVALYSMRSVWENKDIVPKKEARLFLNVIPRLDRCIQLYPQRVREIYTLMEDIISWTDIVFSQPILSEEEAITLVCHHTFGNPPLSIELRSGQIVKGSVSELTRALDALGLYWEKKEQVSKLAVHAMINIQSLLMSVSDLFEGNQKEQFQTIEQEINIRINRSLH